MPITEDIRQLLNQRVVLPDSDGKPFTWHGKPAAAIERLIRNHTSGDVDGFSWADRHTEADSVERRARLYELTDEGWRKTRIGQIDRMAIRPVRFEGVVEPFTLLGDAVAEIAAAHRLRISGKFSTYIEPYGHKILIEDANQ